MKIHVNVMELLIEQEIVKYLKQPQYKHMRGEIVSLMTYALNRVPPIYASSVQGLKSQINRGKQDYSSHIENAVRWSFTAVNKAPRQKSPDLTREIYQRVLAETRAAVKRRELSPIDLPEMIDSMVPPEIDPPEAHSETPPEAHPEAHPQAHPQAHPEAHPEAGEAVSAGDSAENSGEQSGGELTAAEASSIANHGELQPLGHPSDDMDLPLELTGTMLGEPLETDDIKTEAIAL